MTTKKSITCITAGQRTQIVRVCEDAARKAAETAVDGSLLTTDIAQNIVEAGDKLRAELMLVVQQFICGVSVDIRRTEDTLASWQDFYRTEFNIALDPATVRVPQHRPGFDRLVVVAAGLTIQQAYDKCAECFTCWKYTSASLDEAVPTNDRTPANGSYAVRVRDRVEADEEHKNRSANDLKAKNIPGITLIERLTLELKYFRETGKHLDIRNWTLCTGSRNTDGDVPNVNWNPDNRKLKVNWYNSDNANDDLRSREVVSDKEAQIGLLLLIIN